MSDLRASVCLAVHDGASYLAAAVASILAQSERSLELLVVDDGSTDGTGELLARLADPRVTVLGQAHLGLSAALNRCLELARAPVLVRMDADDIALPERVARQLAFLDRHPEVVACGSAIAYFTDGAQRTMTVTLPADHDAILARLRRGGHALCHPTMAIRTEAARSAGGYRVPAPAELTDFALSLAERGRLANLPEVLLHKRVHRAAVGWRHAAEVAAAELAERRRLSGAAGPAPPLARLAARRHAASQVLYRRALVAHLEDRRAAAAVAGALAAALDPARAVARIARVLRGE